MLDRKLFEYSIIIAVENFNGEGGEFNMSWIGWVILVVIGALAG